MNRICNFVLALGLLMATAPILVVSAMVIRFNLGRPVLFRQRRPGIGGRSFTLIKFRTMTDRRNPAGELLEDHERLTGLGRLLRSTSIDELPQLWNVLRGEMNLVGPRPLLEQYLPLYSPRQSRRHEVRPGITGWAQVMGRNSLSWAERLELDVQYVEQRTLALDLKILWMTVSRVINRSGIQHEGHVTMPKFSGTVQ